MATAGPMCSAGSAARNGVKMETLEEWLETVPVIALRAFADGLTGVHEAKRAKLTPFILTNTEARDLATRSMMIEKNALAKVRR